MLLSGISGLFLFYMDLDEAIPSGVASSRHMRLLSRATTTTIALLPRKRSSGGTSTSCGAAKVQALDVKAGWAELVAVAVKEANNRSSLDKKSMRLHQCLPWFGLYKHSWCLQPDASLGRPEDKATATWLE